MFQFGAVRQKSVGVITRWICCRVQCNPQLTLSLVVTRVKVQRIRTSRLRPGRRLITPWRTGADQPRRRPVKPCRASCQPCHWPATEPVGWRRRAGLFAPRLPQCSLLVHSPECVKNGCWASGANGRQVDHGLRPSRPVCATATLNDDSSPIPRLRNCGRSMVDLRATDGRNPFGWQQAGGARGEIGHRRGGRRQHRCG